MESASTPPPFPVPGGGSCPTLHAWRPLVVSVNPPPSSRYVQHERRCSKKLVGLVFV
jgi:hypothetical protein